VVTKEEQVMALLREGNPAIALDEDAWPVLNAAAYLATLEPRSNGVTNREPQFKQGMLVGGVAAGITAAIIAGASLWVWGGGSSRVASESEQGALEMATGFVEAWTNLDADGAAAYLSDDALAEFGDSLETMRLRAQMNRAQGEKWSLGSCEVLDENPELTCPYEFHGLGSDLIGMDPYPGSFRIVGSDGVITDVLDRFTSRTRYTEQVVETFADWVKQTYPSDAPLMWADADDAYQTDETLSEESIRLWEQHRREWANVAERVVILAYPPSNQGGMPPEGAVPSTPTVGEVVTDLGLFGPHGGWAFVYADGRAIWFAHGLDILELQLTPEGLDLVRSGALPLEMLFTGYATLPARAVVDPEIKLFVPPTYAVCGFAEDDYLGFLSSSMGVDLLPTSAQTLLAGKEQTITTRIPFETPPLGLSYSECHELTLADARVFLEVLETEETVSVMPNGNRTDPYTIMMSWDGIDFLFAPILPHGEAMSFPG
jgi:hypothetical protein